VKLFFIPKKVINKLEIMEQTLKTISSITGTKVVNLKGEELGDIKDVALDINAGKVAYAVLSFGGFLGFGEKYFAVPWDTMTLDEQRDQIILEVDVDKKFLEDAPGFNKDEWPHRPDQKFIRQVYDHYGYKPYWDSETLTEEKGYSEKEVYSGKDTSEETKWGETKLERKDRSEDWKK
jgi:sporulation protein YlmC with PRC-barrel domain